MSLIGDAFMFQNSSEFKEVLDTQYKSFKTAMRSET